MINTADSTSHHLRESIAILWDIENVTPSTDSLFVRGLLDYAADLGTLSIARAYGDWTRSGIRYTAEVLADNSFEMIHIPKSKKNSADMTLSTQAVELIHQFPHIGKLVLVTGDADFRPLLQSIRKQNIESIVICDAKSASEDLLLLADHYRDFRELIPDSEDLEEDTGSKSSKITYKESLSLLREAVDYMVKNKRTPSLGAVKVRMKLLNESFSEEKLGFKSWKAFVLKAKEDGAIKTSVKNNDLILDVPSSESSNSDNGSGLPDIIQSFLDGLNDVAGGIKKSTTKWVPLATVGNYLHEKKIDYKAHGYGRFKKLAEAVEKRGLIEHSSKDSSYYVRLTSDGKHYVS